MTNELGERIRALRRLKNRSLKEISTSTGLSTAHLSEIERGLSSPTVSALARIAESLGMRSVDLLRPGPAPGGLVTARGNRRMVAGGAHGFTVSLLVEDPGPGLLSCYLVQLASGPPRDLSCIESGSVACLYVLLGSVEVGLGDARGRMEEADSLQLLVDPSPLRLQAIREAAEILIVTFREAPAPPIR